MIRAAVLDLDGTLIGPNEEIPPRVHRSVCQLASKLPVSIATGRESADAIKFARQLGLTSPQISDGGANILDPAGGKALWTATLEPGVARDIIDALRGGNTAFIATHSGASITDFSQITHYNFIRVSALDLAEPEADRILSRFSTNQKLYVVKVYLPYNQLWAVDFTQFGVDKATAATKLGEILEVCPVQMVAVGDSYNDLPLLRICGLRIVMGQAPEELKALADYVAPPVEEDGLAVAIEEFVMPRL